ncbi:NAD(P)H-binding protein [Glycomyces sp. TRM65418]|uniref:NAD(P)H-binding protein n=1 Tax=Glycomyces sp. TRM65418 TaxID=2867006 RepID=UPI001CE5BBFE|nr:NAD(P)H-binding protein [Glycomyces sp. TRM65418]MCC3765082.1 NAD(P)H-binding protein [Glycomyces sp. TRM65418]QZD54711.1 NAD(P)H-binding protein [Glycomyces sp. TRM65418]
MTILITGATGNIGRHIIRLLTAADHSVRALTRDPAKADLPAGVEVRAGDFTDFASLEAALEGATALHLMTAFGPANTTVPNSRDLFAAAEKAGVRRVTLLWNGYAGPVEEAVEASGLEWTHLRPGEFMSNALGWAEQIRTEGVVREAYGEIGHSPVHEVDVAAVAAAALTEEGHAGKAYMLTGPEVITVPEQVAAIAAAIGKDVRYEAEPPEGARERMRALGFEEDAIDYVLGWRADPPEFARTVSKDVEAAAGRPAKTFAAWARDHADAFR